MEQRQQFAEYITVKRKAADLSQRELADKLYVTNTAVSKWERGLSYPDITLVMPICEALQITPQEFLSACDDVKARREKKESGYYRKIARGYHMITMGCYALSILACLIVNLITEGALTWSLIVSASVLLAFSFTNLPFFARHLPEKYRAKLTAACFLLPLALLYILLLSTGIYASLSWLPTAALGILLGYSLIVLPFFLKSMNGLSSGLRAIILATVPYVCLLALLLCVCVRTGGTWFLIAMFGTLTAFAAIVMPNVLARQSEWARKWNLMISASSALLSAAALVFITYIQFAR